MSQENIELARRVFEAFAQGGPEAVVDFSDPEIELWLPSGMIQAGGTYRGREAVLGWMKEWAEAWEEIEYTPEEFTEKDGAVVVGVLYEGRGKGSGVRTEGRFWYVFKYRKGRLWRWELYPERAQALEAVGLAA
jgi:ketosteroid isomerase-like protein